MSNKSRFLEDLAKHLANGLSVRDAAKKIGMAESTAYRTSKSDECVQLVNQLKGAAAQDAAGKLNASACEAVDIIKDIMTNKKSSEPAPSRTVRLNAAKSVLGLLMPFTEHTEYRKRIEAIEAKQAAGDAGTNSG